MKIQIKKLHPEAKLPSFAHDTDAGLDLCTVEDFTLAPGERQSVPTGIAMSVPAGYVALIWDKGGVSHKRGIKSLGGVVDAGYTGEIFAGMLNTSNEPQVFAAGDKIAQILIQKIEQPEIIVVDELADTTRGEGRFGSTGK